MRTIERATAFKRDFKRAKATPRYGKDLDTLVSAIIALLLTDQDLPEIYRDHALIGDWSGYRECHLKPDLLLIYPEAGPGNTSLGADWITQRFVWLKWGLKMRYLFSPVCDQPPGNRPGNPELPIALLCLRHRARG